MTATANLLDLFVTVEGPYDDDGQSTKASPRAHAVVTIESAPWRASYGYEDALPDDVAAADLSAASRHVAGLLGRVALWSAPWLALESQEHRCRGSAYPPGYGGRPSYPGEPPSMNDGCRLDVHETTEYRAGALAFSVPWPARAAWLERIRGWLTILADES